MRLGHMLLGFVSAALAVLFFHQAAITWMNGMGWIPNPAYRQTPIAPWGVPAVYNSMFWGGLWGALFGLLHGGRQRLPLLPAAVLFCITLPVFGAWVIVPAIKGTPFFAGGNTAAMARVIGIYAVWGVGLAMFWSVLGRLVRR
jgi:hypothetical protein